MKVTSLKIPDIKLIEPQVFEDDRGFFFESFNQQKFNDLVTNSITFVQDNHSKSSRGVLRGLHYQLQPFAQGKLVSVLQGEILDVAVDIRRSSSTFGQYVSQVLSADNKKKLWVPIGFAHGFLTLSDTAEVFYKATDFYSPANERCIIWNDQALGIEWPRKFNFIHSPKDLLGDKFLHASLFP